MPPFERFTGDDWEFSLTLKVNGTVYDVSTATDISVAIISSDTPNASVLISAPALSSGAAGADWTNGVVVVEIPAADTGITQYGTRYLELQVTMDGKKHTWPRAAIQVKKGTIA